MREDLKRLLYIQSLDLQVQGLVKDKEIKKHDLQTLEEEIKREEERAGEEEKVLKNNQLRIRTLELEVEDKKNHIQKFQQQSSQVKSNKEYQALLQEMGNLQADIKKIEDEILEEMEKADAGSRELESLKAELKTNQQQYKQENEAAEREFGQIGRKIEEVAARREQVTSSMDEELLDKYNRIFKHKIGAAIVPIDHKICGGCHMQLTAQVVNDLQKDDRIMYCENCGRLIYLKEEET